MKTRIHLNTCKNFLNAAFDPKTCGCERQRDEAKASHTPTPLKMEYWDGAIITPELLRDKLGTSLAHSKRIVRAVNSHEELLTALRSVRNEFRAYVLNDPKNLETALGSRILAQIDRAITKAEGK